MSKTKTPFMSMGAKGTVGGSLTSQKRGSATILREKPVPTDPYTLAQAYQRWDYKDYAYLWTLESEASKQSYRTRGSRYHITGFSLWMREQLKTLPDILGRWHLDEAGGAIAFDSSKQSNNGVITGASPTTGIIGPCLDFDGVNDDVQVGVGPLYSTTTTLECWLKLANTTQTSKAVIGQLSKWFWGSYGSGFTYHNGFLYLMSEKNNDKAALFVALADTDWHHLAGIVRTPNGKLFLDGVLVAAGDLDSGYIYTFGIGASVDDGLRLGIGNYLDALIDEVRLTDGALDDTLIKRHSERRYP